MPGDPFTGYFTPERRGRFEELRERFPHWCIDLPKVAGLRAPVTSVRRLASAIREMRADLKGWERSPKLPDDEQLEALIDEATGRAVRFDDSVAGTHDQAEIDIPAIHLALFKAIALTVNASPERGLPLGNWSRRLHQMLVSDDSASSETRRRLSMLAVKAWVTSAGAARSGSQMRKDMAETARKQLSQYWQLIGEQIGLNPPSCQGGLADLIPDEWLSALAAQAEDLLRQVRAYQPDTGTGERDAVRALLLAEPCPAGSDHELTLAREYGRRGKPRTTWDNQVGLDQWCHRLAFPMLTAKEIATAATSSGWRWLLVERLDMSENVLSIRLSQYRHSS